MIDRWAESSQRTERSCLAPNSDRPSKGPQVLLNPNIDLIDPISGQSWTKNHMTITSNECSFICSFRHSTNIS